MRITRTGNVKQVSITTVMVRTSSMFQIFLVIIFISQLTPSDTNPGSEEDSNRLSEHDDYNPGFVDNHPNKEPYFDLFPEDKEQHMYYSETLTKAFKEAGSMDEINKLYKLEQKPKETNKGESKEEESINSTTLPELLLLIFLGVFVCLLVCLVCIGSKSCVERFLAGRQRLKKALQYRPGKYRTRVTPIPAVEQAGTEEYAMGNFFQIS